MSEAIVIEIIKALGLALAAGVPSLAALLISRSRHKAEVLKRDLEKALHDLSFLLAVEAEHGRMHKEQTGASNIRLVRRVVHAQDALNWSGAFHRKGIDKKLQSLKDS